MAGVKELGFIGAEEDRSEAGLLRVRSTRGDGILVPFRNGGYFNADTVGAGSGVSYQAQFAQQEGGFGGGINLAVGDVGFGFGSRVMFNFYGPMLGIAFQRSGLLTTDHLSVGIDSEYYRLNSYNDWLTLRSINIQDAYSLAFVAEDIPDLPRGQPHTAEVVLCSNHAAGSNTLRLFGYIADRRAGYSPPNRTILPYHQTVTASAVALGIGTSTTMARTIRKVFCYNSGSEPRVVTIKNLTDIIWQKTIQPGDTEVWDPGAEVAQVANHTIQADVTGDVKATVYAGI